MNEIQPDYKEKACKVCFTQSEEHKDWCKNLRKLRVLKDGQKYASLLINDSDTVGIYNRLQAPFEVQQLISNYVAGQSSIVTYREWRWMWDE